MKLFRVNCKQFLLILVLLCASTSGVFAQSKSQLEKEKTKIENEIKKLNNELSKAKKNTKLNNNQLSALNKKIKERNKLINNINSQMNILDRQIGKAQDSIAHMRMSIDSMKSEYAKVIRVLYKEHDNISPWVLLFDNKTYNKSYLRLKYFNEYSRYRQQQANAIKLRENELTTVSNELLKQKSEKKSLLDQEKRNKAELDKEQKLKQKSVNDSRAQEKKLTSQISQKEKQKKQLQQQIQKLISEEVAKANAAKKPTAATSSGSSTTSNSTASRSTSSAAETAMSTEFVGNKGRLGWPVFYKKVLREYGRYTHESGGENMNNGIDLQTSAGAPVYCVFNGIVSRIFTCPNGSKGIIVRHGEFMTVYTNMATVSVKQGGNVSTKQQIGTVQSNGDGTGDFGFQIWKGTSSQNPRAWLR